MKNHIKGTSSADSIQVIKIRKVANLFAHILHLLQFLKAPSPIDVTSLGIVSEVNLLQFLKAPFPIDVFDFIFSRDKE